jgi:flavorubredoxin
MKMAKALIVYSTRNGETRNIGEIIAEGLRFSLIDVTMKDVKEIKSEADIIGYDAYAFGSSTYHGEMMGSMKTFLFLAEKGQLQGKKGGSFGSFGWSGEAAERIYDTMKNIYGMDMVNSPLMLKTSTVEGGIKLAQAYGKELAAKILEK